MHWPVVSRLFDHPRVNGTSDLPACGMLCCLTNPFAVPRARRPTDVARWFCPTRPARGTIDQKSRKIGIFGYRRPCGNAGFQDNGAARVWLPLSTRSEAGQRARAASTCEGLRKGEASVLPDRAPCAVAGFLHAFLRQCACVLNAAFVVPLPLEFAYQLCGFS